MGGRRRPGKLFVISSPSGGGKTTLVQALLRAVPGLVRSVSVTTRPRRGVERHGTDYHFVSPDVFRRMIARGALTEWARVHGHRYGTPQQPIARALRAGRHVVMSIDVQGARKIRRRFGRRAALIFVLPPSLRDLRMRLMRRRTDDAERIRRRLEEARRELACVPWYDYAVVNRTVAQAVEQLKAIVTAESLRVDSAQRGGRP